MALKRKSKSEWWRYEGNEFGSDVMQNTFTVSTGVTTRDGAECILMEEQEMKTMEASELEAIAEQDLKEEEETNQTKAQEIMNRIEHTKLKEVVDSIQICFDPDDTKSLIQEDNSTMEQYNLFENILILY